jgi:hypothetical protein
LTFQRSVKKTIVEHLGQVGFLQAKQNVILLGLPFLGRGADRECLSASPVDVVGQAVISL